MSPCECGCECCGSDGAFEIYEGPLTKEETEWRESQTARYLYAKLIERSNIKLIASRILEACQ